MTGDRAQLRAAALAQIDRGHTYAQVSRETGVSVRTLMRWRAAARAEQDNPEPSPPAPIVPPPAPPPALEGDRRRGVRETAALLAAESIAIATEARQVGNATAATRALKNANDANNQLLRAERDQRDDSDLIKMSREQIEAAQRQVAERLAVLSKIPITCAECGRKLRIRAASGGEAEA